jgi:hypothetical protein
MRISPGYTVAYRGGGGGANAPNPQNSEVLTKLSRILCPLSSALFVEPPLNKTPGYATAIICGKLQNAE